MASAAYVGHEGPFGAAGSLTVSGWTESFARGDSIGSCHEHWPLTGGGLDRQLYRRYRSLDRGGRSNLAKAVAVVGRRSPVPGAESPKDYRPV